MNVTETYDTAAKGTIDGMILISNSWVHALFDIDASYSFISMVFASILGLEFENSDQIVNVSVPLERACNLSLVCQSVRIDIDSKRFLADLIVMLMNHFDVILDMDWLLRY